MDTDDEFMRAVVFEETADLFDRLTDESTRRTITLADGTTATMTEAEWMASMQRVAKEYGWTVASMPWQEADRLMYSHCGVKTDRLMDPEVRKVEVFDKLISRTKSWRQPERLAWSSATLVGLCLAELSYFGSPDEMIQWVQQVDAAEKLRLPYRLEWMKAHDKGGMND